MRIPTLPFVVLAVLLVVPGWSGWDRLALLGSEARVTATRVPLDPGDHGRRRLGHLTYMGGVQLESPDPAFGGFSALTVTGDRFTLLSDGGNIVRLRLGADGSVHDVRFAELPGGPGTGWRKWDRDGEALAVDPRTGEAWVAFERANAIYRFTPGLGAVAAASRPAAMRRWSTNGGAESLVRRRDGSFVAIEEGGRGATRAMLVWRGDPTADSRPALRLRYRPPVGYSPADATELPDGRLLVLSRWWGFPLRFANVLEVIERAAIRPGAVVRGKRVAMIGAPLTHDNFEGVAATVEGGRTIVWLLSDDGQSSLERTLLMKFRLD